MPAAIPTVGGSTNTWGTELNAHILVHAVAATGVLHNILQNAADTNTILDLGSTVADKVTLTVGNEVFLTCLEDGSQDIMTIGDGGDIDFKVLTAGSAFFVEGSTGNVGHGTTLPLGQIHTQQLAGDTQQYFDVYSSNSGNTSLFHFRRSLQNTFGFTANPTGSWLGNIRFEGVNSGNTAFVRGAEIRVTQSGAAGANNVGADINFMLATSSVGVSSVLFLDPGLNVGVGATSFGTSAARVLGIANGTVPGSSPPNMIQLYAEDVAASSELKVRDEAGNVSTLSPHNFSLFTPDKAYEMPWSYYSENGYVGKKINVDMFGAIRAIEQLVNKKFIYIGDIAPDKLLDWETDQQRKADDRDAEFEKLTDRLAEMETLIAAEADETDRDNLIAHRGDITVPDAFSKKDPPQWIKERMSI